MGILISSLYPNVVSANGLYICMSLDLDDAIVEDWLNFDIENVSHF